MSVTRSVMGGDEVSVGWNGRSVWKETFFAIWMTKSTACFSLGMVNW